MSYVLYTDGSIEGGNPGGWATAGWVLYDTDGCFIERGCIEVGRGGKVTNNQAEYAAVLNGVRQAKCIIAGESAILVRSDSKLVVNQMQGKWRCSNHLLDNYRHLIRRSAELAGFSLSYEWIPRAQNSAADLMSRMPYMREKGWAAAEKFTKKLDDAIADVGEDVRKSFART